LYEATHGLVFFGTPHWGAKKVSLGEIAASIARFVSGGKEKNSFLEALEKSSAFAESNRDDFTNRSRDFRFISFFESTKTSGHQVRFTMNLSSSSKALYRWLNERVLLCIFPTTLRIKSP
jgi:hypothetical protein